MISYKYLFSIIAGLTGSINAWALSTSGVITGKSLEGINQDLDSLSGANDSLIQKEHTRLEAEKKTSDENFDKLEESNKSTKEQSKLRQQSGDRLIKANYELTVERTQQSMKLTDTSRKLSQSLSESTAKFKEDLEKKVTEYHGKLKQTVDDETKKLSTALENLKESNSKLIETVRENINKMPNRLFEFSDETSDSKVPQT